MTSLVYQPSHLQPNDWEIVAVLPNLTIETQIFSRNIALVSRESELIDLKLTNNEKTATFLHRFTDQFGIDTVPSIVLVKGNFADRKISVDLISSFRDILSATIIPRDRAITIKNDRSGLLVWSDALDIYPWHISNDGQYLVSFTPAQTSLHLPEEFSGQTNPSIPAPYRIQRIERYEVALDRLLCLWEQHYIQERSTPFLRRLFRSLNMANQALRMPGARDVNIYDVGRTIALWVSAFEILAHPGKPIGYDTSNQVSRGQVLQELKKCSWKSEKLTSKSYDVLINGKSHKGTLPQKIYSAIYEARNKFLHGNPVSHQDLKYPESGKSLFFYAPLLYSAFLTRYISLNSFSKKTTEDQSSYRWIFGYGGQMRDIEEGLKMIDIIDEKER